MVEDRSPELGSAATDQFNVGRLIRLLVDEDADAARERQAMKRTLAFGLVSIGVLRRLFGDNPIEKLRAAAMTDETERTAEPTSSLSKVRSVLGRILRLTVATAVLVGVAYAVRKRRGSDDEGSDPDETERDITDTSVAEEDVMETDAADESDVDEMVEAVENEEGEVPPAPGETVVEGDIVDAVTESEEGSDENVDTDAEEADGTDGDETSEVGDVETTEAGEASGEEMTEAGEVGGEETSEESVADDGAVADAPTDDADGSDEGESPLEDEDEE